MRTYLFLCLFMLLGTSASLQAQPSTVSTEAISQEMVADVLKQLDYRWTVDDWKYNVKTKDREFKLYRLDDGKRLLLRAPVHSKEKPSLATLNRYNERSSASMRAVKNQDFGLVLESGIDCQLGVTPAGLKKHVARFVNEIGEFEKFVATDTKREIKEISTDASDRKKVPLKIAKDSEDKEFVITFPTKAETWRTAWKIVWDMEDFSFTGASGSKLFKIKKAFLKPSQDSDWIQVLEDAHPQEFYVPYYFRGTRFFDLRDVGGYTTLSAHEGGAVSQLLGKSKRVMAELRDTGINYKHGDISRRGEELTLWANFQAGNYTYMVEYGFRDDGVIVFRHSPTGYNYFSHLDASHMHGSYWRIGMKLGPEGNNDVNQVFSISLPTEPKAQAEGGKLKINEIKKESYVDWQSQEFTRIRVSNPKFSLVSENKKELPIAYDLVTQPQGIARHHRFADEGFTHHDFWITRHDCPEKHYVKLGKYFEKEGQPNPKLLDLEKKNIVLWHSSAALHTPRSEDGIIGGNSRTNGQATVFWTTFELRPRNIFNGTPLFRVNEEVRPKIDAKRDVERQPDGR